MYPILGTLHNISLVRFAYFVTDCLLSLQRHGRTDWIPEDWTGAISAQARVQTSMRDILNEEQDEESLFLRLVEAGMGPDEATALAQADINLNRVSGKDFMHELERRLDVG